MYDIIVPHEVQEGQGARALRVLGEGRHLDPIVLLDEYSIPPGAGFPMHGHGGFEGFQLLMEGSTLYRDNMGNRGIVEEGGGRKFRAVPGFEHSEESIGGVRVRGYLLWSKLPPGHYGGEEIYVQAQGERFPVETEGGLLKKHIIGKGSPLEPAIQVEMTLITGEGSGKLNVEKGWNGLVYLAKGTLSMDALHLRGIGLGPQKGVILPQGATRFELLEGSEMVFVKGSMTGLPMIQDGGYVL